MERYFASVREKRRPDGKGSLGFFRVPNEELTVFRNAASVPSASVTSFSQFVLPVDMITYVVVVITITIIIILRKHQGHTCRR
jgi:hypothetical protein